MSRSRSATKPKRAIPPLTDLHERHYGLTKEVCWNNAQAAAVALDRHHAPPALFTVVCGAGKTVALLRWEVTDDRTRAAWANVDNTTEYGAVAIALASVELELGLTAIQRAETRTGCDYYVAEPGDELEDAFRLEVAGNDHGDASSVRSRLSKKIRQTKEGKSNLPAIASVVGFKALEVRIAKVATPDEAEGRGE